MSKQDYPVTPAVRYLKEHKIFFVPYLFKYEEKGGTKHTAQELKVDEHSVIKTLVFETESGSGLIILMHGDREVSTKELARFLGVKQVKPCDAKKAEKLTGYIFGGTSPFGTRTRLPIFAETSIFGLSTIFINGGKQGFIIEIKPAALTSSLEITEVNAAV